MYFRNEYRKKAHQEIEFVFRKLLPQNNLHVREEQIHLCHEMLDTLLGGNIALCDAGVGIGKTYAYLLACVLMRKYSKLRSGFSKYIVRPVVISTSSIALQRAIIEEYIPFLSQLLVCAGTIQVPLKGVVRKGKEHFVCDSRLDMRLEAVEGKKKNDIQQRALISLKQHYDMDEVHGLSGFDRRMVCVPKFCPKECLKRGGCRYQEYLKTAKSEDVFIQICNHNYLLADSLHREKDYRPLLTDYQALIVDEAHKLPESARQMYGKGLSRDDILETSNFLEKEHKLKEAGILRELYEDMVKKIQEEYQAEEYGEKVLYLTDDHLYIFKDGIHRTRTLIKRLEGKVPRWIISRLEEVNYVLERFYQQDSKYILYIQKDKQRLPMLCAISRETPKHLYRTLWSKGFPSILTSGTLKAGNGFSRTKQITGLEKKAGVREYVAESPFEYKKNCLLFLPQTLKPTKKGSQEEVSILAEHIQRLIYATHGHTLVLFTSYNLMGGVYQQLKDSLPFPMVEVWRHSQEEIARFKTLDNAVLFAAGSCWEGVDFPGDMVSSLIIVKLPFAVPDPVSEAEKEQYETLEQYIQEIIVPDMQKKLRQGFGRAIRTEQDTCVVSILDYRAIAGGKYYSNVMSALPACRMTDSIKEVEQFIRNRKEKQYYM